MKYPKYIKENIIIRYYNIHVDYLDYLDFLYHKEELELITSLFEFKSPLYEKYLNLTNIDNYHYYRTAPPNPNLANIIEIIYYCNSFFENQNNPLVFSPIGASYLYLYHKLNYPPIINKKYHNLSYLLSTKRYIKLHKLSTIND